MNDLEGRLQWVEDRFAINDLIVQYSIATDDRDIETLADLYTDCLLYTSPSPRDATLSRMPSSA